MIVSSCEAKGRFSYSLGRYRWCLYPPRVKIWFPYAQCSSAVTQHTRVQVSTGPRCILLCCKVRLVSSSMLMLVLLPVLWVIKTPFPVLGVSYVLPESMKRCQSNLLSCRLGKIQNPRSFTVFKKGFIKVHFTYDKIQKLIVHSTIVFCIFTELCKHHHNLILEHFQHFSKKPHTHQ